MGLEPQVLPPSCQKQEPYLLLMVSLCKSDPHRHLSSHWEKYPLVNTNPGNWLALKCCCGQERRVAPFGLDIHRGRRLRKR
jgi:hypothetical protein